MEQIHKTQTGGVQQGPYEKCMVFGAQSLTDAELLAVILRTGTVGVSSVMLAEQILKLSKSSDGLLGIHHISINELMNLQGIGKVKAVQIKCIGELSKRIATVDAKRQLSFQDPKSIADYYMERLRHAEQEIMICMLLDTKNQLIGDETIYKGTVNASLVSPREIFLSALRYRAVHIILIHNHPSGISTPSREDILLTHRITSAGQLLDITLLDHVIIGDHNYTSMRQAGIIR